MGWAEAVFLSGQRCGLEAAWDVPIRAAGIIFQEAGQDLAEAADSVDSAVAASVVVVRVEAGNQKTKTTLTHSKSQDLQSQCKMTNELTCVR